MNRWLVQFDWQEDDNSPTGGKYYFTVSKDGIELFNTEHHTMETAWIDVLGELRSRGEL
jgi:hypothetical protein